MTLLILSERHGNTPFQATVFLGHEARLNEAQLERIKAPIARCHSGNNFSDKPISSAQVKLSVSS